MEKKFTNKEVAEVQNGLEFEGFDVTLSTDNEYFRLCFKNQILISDSANEDLYDVENAIMYFNDVLREIYSIKRWRGVVKTAIEKGFSFKANEGLDNILINAENFIIKSTPLEERKYDVVSDFWNNFRGQSQSLEWYDEDNECCISACGQIIADRSQDRSYIRVQDGKLSKAEWFESEEDDVYTYLDTVVTTKGQVYTLIA